MSTPSMNDLVNFKIDLPSRYQWRPTSSPGWLGFARFVIVTSTPKLPRERSGAARTIALVNQDPYRSLVAALGVDAVVSPNLAAVSAILQFIRRGKVVSATAVAEEGAEALEIVALETSELVGRPLREIKLDRAIVGAIVRGEEVIIPAGDDVIEVGDHVVIFAKREAIRKLEQQMMVKLQYF